jgi:diaminopimelate decarboxylase
MDTPEPADPATPPAPPRPVRHRSLADAARRWGTPVWVTDLDRAASHLADYRAALPGALLAYAVKANADPQLLRRLVADGAGCEVVTRVELALALRSGCPPERVVMNGVGRTDEELRAALAIGVLVNAESLEDLAVLVAAGRGAPGRARIGLRLNPALEATTHPHLATGSRGAKFGIALADLPLALATLRDAGLPLAALGAHIGSDIGDLSVFVELARVLAEAERAAAAIELPPERIDIGGGLASGNRSALAALAEAVRSGLGDPHRLICEPGRSLVADAGWLITRVVRVQPRQGAGHAYLVADAGMTDLVRPVLYGADHPLSLLVGGETLDVAAATGAMDGEIHLAGPVCEAGDVLARNIGRWLSPAELAAAGTGALLAIGSAGAYGAAMSSTYNGRPRAAEAVLERGELRLSRRRETIEDLVVRDV